MTARHAAVTAPPTENCPFCGCGRPLAEHARTARAPRGTRSGEPYTLTCGPRAGQTIITTGRTAAYLRHRRALPQSWLERDRTGEARAYPEAGTRAFTPSELRDQAVMLANLAAHGADVAVVDPATNEITEWRAA